MFDGLLPVLQAALDPVSTFLETLLPARLRSVLWADDLQTQLFILAILFVAAAAFLVVLLPLAWRRLRICRIEKRVRKVTAQSQTSAAMREDLERLLSRAASPQLREVWKEFRTRWHDAAAALHEDDRKRTDAGRAPVRLGEFFADQPLLPLGWRRSLLTTLPGLFIGLGILGTFVGIILAISPGGQASGDDLGAIKTAVGLAFRTSIWGITLSLLFALSSRALEGSFEAAEEALDRHVRAAYPWLSPDELVAESGRRQDAVLCELQDAVATLGTSLQQAVDEGLGRIAASTESLGSSLGQAIHEGLQRIGTSTETLAREFADSQRGQLEAITADLREALTSAVQELVGRLRDAVSDSIERQESLVRNLHALFEQLERAAASHQSLAADLAAASENVTTASEAIGRAATDLGPAVQHLTEASRSLESTSESIRGTQEAAAAAVAAVSDALRQASDSLETQQRLVETSLRKVEGSIRSLNEGLADGLAQALGRIDHVLSDPLERLGGTLLENQEIFEGQSEVLRHQSETLRQLGESLPALADVTREAARSVGGLSEALTPLRELPSAMSDSASAERELLPALGQLAERAAAIPAALDRFREEASARERALEHATGALQSRMGEAVAGLGEIQKWLERVTALEEGLRELTHAQRAGVEALKQIPGAADAFETALADLQRQQAERLAQMRSELQRLSDQITEAAATLRDRGDGLNEGLAGPHPSLGAEFPTARPAPTRGASERPPAARVAETRRAAAAASRSTALGGASASAASRTGVPDPTPQRAAQEDDSKVVSLEPRERDETTSDGGRPSLFRRLFRRG